ncbi:MAG: right-handed parallel beta-helix repeat-containing protein [Dehalococcoidia bacterium]|jgi:hypothetical protein
MAYENKGAMAATIVVAASDSLNKAAANYVCDGVADNVEIQAAIDALPAGGGKVVLLEGTFNLASTLTGIVGLALVGCGKNTILFLSDGAECHMVNLVNLSDVSICDIVFDGNRAGQTVAAHIVRIENTPDVYLEYLEVKNAAQHGIIAVAVGSNGRIIVQSCYTHDNGDAINVGSGVYLANADNSVVSDLISHDNTADGCQFINSDNLVISATCVDNDRYGIMLDASHNAIIKGICKGSSVGCYMGASNYANMDIVSQDNKLDGIRFQDCIYCNCNFNSLNNGQGGIGAGLNLRGATNHCNIRGIALDNQGIATQDYGVLEGNTSDYNNIRNVVVVGYSTLPMYIVGLHTIVDKSYISVKLDLSGAAADIEVYFADTPGCLVGYTIVYTEASSADAGVNVRLGRYQDGVALDDDYFDLVVSEVSKALGYHKTYVSGDLTQKVIAAGDTVTVGTAGGKTGTGEVMIILHIAEMAS